MRRVGFGILWGIAGYVCGARRAGVTGTRRVRS